MRDLAGSRVMGNNCTAERFVYCNVETTNSGTETRTERLQRKGNTTTAGNGTV